jgi:hypothetical protein
MLRSITRALPINTGYQRGWALSEIDGAPMDSNRRKGHCQSENHPRKPPMSTILKIEMIRFRGLLCVFIRFFLIRVVVLLCSIFLTVAPLAVCTTSSLPYSNTNGSLSSPNSIDSVYSHRTYSLLVFVCTCTCPCICDLCMRCRRRLPGRKPEAREHTPSAICALLWRAGGRCVVGILSSERILRLARLIGWSDQSQLVSKRSGCTRTPASMR